MLKIDGAMGEGGGQILRTSLALALMTGQPVRIENIRAGRKKPGLLRQHLTAVQAAAAIGAQIHGAELGATELVIEPQHVRGGDHHFAVGTAGSACLVLQTILPPLIAAGQAACIEIEGGTHNPFAPPFDFVERVFAPVLARLGASLECTLERRGFYPAGGGNIRVELAARAGALTPCEILERGEITLRRARAIVAHIPGDVAKRELAAAQKRLDWPADAFQIEVDGASKGPGNVLLLEVSDGINSELCAGFGERHVRAERVAKNAVLELERYLEGQVPVGRRLADQLMLPFALAGGGAFRTLALSEHSRTNLAVIERFAPGATAVHETAENDVTVSFTAELSSRVSRPAA